MMKTEEAAKQLPGVRKAAVLMALLGTQKAADVLSRCSLPHGEIERLAFEMSRLNEIDAATQQAVVGEFTSLLTSTSAAVDGLRLAQDLLGQVVGPEIAAGIISELKVQPFARSLSSLSDLQPAQLSSALSSEQPQVIAVVLRCIPRKLAGKVLSGLPEAVRMDAVMHVIQGGEPAPDAIKQIETALSQEVGALTSWSASDRQITAGGPRTLVEILNHTDLSVEDAVIKSLTERDPQLGEQVRESMFIFDDLPRLDPRTLQLLLREVEPTDLALALKGASEAVKEVVFQNLSENAAAGLKEDLESLGPARRRDVFAAQEKIVTAVRQQVSEGKINLRQESEPDDLIA
jgi:flagellar motor switch protein FliG